MNLPLFQDRAYALAIGLNSGEDLRWTWLHNVATQICTVVCFVTHQIRRLYVLSLLTFMNIYSELVIIFLLYLMFICIFYTFISYICKKIIPSQIFTNLYVRNLKSKGKMTCYFFVCTCFVHYTAMDNNGLYLRSSHYFSPKDPYIISTLMRKSTAINGIPQIHKHSNLCIYAHLYNFFFIVIKVFIDN